MLRERQFEVKIWRNSFNLMVFCFNLSKLKSDFLVRQTWLGINEPWRDISISIAQAGQWMMHLLVFVCVKHYLSDVFR
jgi:hypothetical protein